MESFPERMNQQIGLSINEKDMDYCHINRNNFEKHKHRYLALLQKETCLTLNKVVEDVSKIAVISDNESHYQIDNDKRPKKITKCMHKDAKFYARGMCKYCYAQKKMASRH